MLFDSDTEINETHKFYETCDIDLTISDPDSPAAGPSHDLLASKRERGSKTDGKDSNECTRYVYCTL